jgi:hypothetical protein
VSRPTFVPRCDEAARLSFPNCEGLRDSEPITGKSKVLVNCRFDRWSMSVMTICQQLTARFATHRNKKQRKPFIVRFVYRVCFVMDSSQFTIAACIAIR